VFSPLSFGFGKTREQMSVEYRVTAGDGSTRLGCADVAVVALEDDGELYVHGYLSDHHAREDARARGWQWSVHSIAA